MPVAVKKFGSIGVVDLETDAEKWLENLQLIACMANLLFYAMYYIVESSNDNEHNSKTKIHTVTLIVFNRNKYRALRKEHSSTI